MKPLEKQRELYKKTQELRNLDLQGVKFELSKGIREEEQKAYDQWLFYKNIRKEMERVKKDE